MYFDGYESKEHLDAKHKLFELILSRRIKVTDQDNNLYEIFRGKDDTEFLHVESFVMNYNNKVLFSNEYAPCANYITNEKNPMCNMKGYYGAFKELPCEKCVKVNFGNEIEKHSKYASYRPDIAFGYRGEHKIWLEIVKTNSCSEYKSKFCKDNNIILLEIDANKVNKFNEHNGALLFKKIEYIPPEVDTSIIVDYINNQIDSNGFASVKSVRDKFAVKVSHLSYKKPEYTFDDFLEDNGFITIFDGLDGVMYYFGHDNKKKLIIKEYDYKKVLGIQRHYELDCLEKTHEIFSNLRDQVASNGLIMTNEFKKRVEEYVPKGHIKRINFTDKFREYGLISIRYGKFENELRKIKAVDNRSKSVIITIDMYDGFNK